MGLMYLRVRSSKKKNPTKKELEAEESFKKLQAKWDKVPKFASSAQKPEKKAKPKPTLDDLTAPPALVGKLDAGSTAPRKSTQYTGTKMIGIGTLHKSNAVPVFTSEAAVDIAKMRRG